MVTAAHLCNEIISDSFFLVAFTYEGDLQDKNLLCLVILITYMLELMKIHLEILGSIILLYLWGFVQADGQLLTSYFEIL